MSCIGDIKPGQPGLVSMSYEEAKQAAPPIPIIPARSPLRVSSHQRSVSDGAKRTSAPSPPGIVRSTSLPSKGPRNTTSSYVLFPRDEAPRPIHLQQQQEQGEQRKQQLPPRPPPPPPLWPNSENQQLQQTISVHGLDSSAPKPDEPLSFFDDSDDDEENAQNQDDSFDFRKKFRMSRNNIRFIHRRMLGSSGAPPPASSSAPTSAPLEPVTEDRVSEESSMRSNPPGLVSSSDTDSLSPPCTPETPPDQHDLPRSLKEGNGHENLNPAVAKIPQHVFFASAFAAANTVPLMQNCHPQPQVANNTRRLSRPFSIRSATSALAAATISTTDVQGIHNSQIQRPRTPVSRLARKLEKPPPGPTSIATKPERQQPSPVLMKKQEPPATKMISNVAGFYYEPLEDRSQTRRRSASSSSGSSGSSGSSRMRGHQSRNSSDYSPARLRKGSGGGASLPTLHILQPVEEQQQRSLWMSPSEEEEERGRVSEETAGDRSSVGSSLLLPFKAPDTPPVLETDIPNHELDLLVGAAGFYPSSYGPNYYRTGAGFLTTTR